MGKASTKKEKMFGLVERYQTSLLPFTGFCRLHKLTPRQLRYWIKKYREFNSPMIEVEFLPISVESGLSRSSATAQEFVPIPASGVLSEPPGSHLSILYPDGVELRFDGGMSAEDIRELLPFFTKQ